MTEEHAAYRLKQAPEDFKVIEEADLNLDKESKGPFLIFKLQKKNYTTENAIQQIAKSLHLPRKQLGYAGSKDSKAITEQYISIRGVSKERAASLNLKDIELEYVGSRQEPLSLGDLRGNRFEITIRNLEEGEKPKQIRKMLNLFGEQRFSVNNAEIGKAILKKDLKRAVELITESSAADANTMDEHLSKSRNDYCGALKKLPFKTLTIYIHAFQSKLWNKAAEEIARKGKDNKKAHKKDAGKTWLSVVGFGTEYHDEEERQIYTKILAEEGITQSDFVVRAIPALTSGGTEREFYAEIQNLEIGEPEDDDLNPGKKKCKVKFSLGKGSYATEAVKAMMG
ncbi:tRNA pseudouridine(13) synthase TruD [Candidatus Woesearchaeota archaeon]|nr:tRNA pseudouridine(13) synthase TruD [Candidatus Woesearchaeota archaeon]